MKKAKRTLIGLWTDKKANDIAPVIGVWSYINKVRLHREFVK